MGTVRNEEEFNDFLATAISDTIYKQEHAEELAGSICPKCKNKLENIGKYAECSKCNSIFKIIKTKPTKYEWVYVFPLRK